jgi:transaldolase
MIRTPGGLGGFMKIFLDSADLDEIRAAVATGLVDGLTTNPSLLARSAVSLPEFLPVACELVGGPVSAPVRAADSDGIVREGRALARLHPAVVVKIPIHSEGLRAIARLHGEGVRTHATLCCAAVQALLAARSGADYVSPLLGRVEEAGESGLDLIAQIIEIYDNYEFDTRIVVASLRSARQVQECARLGADAVTIPKRVLDELVRHPITERLDEAFRADWERL